ncbi:MAG: hypothetical protein SGPRY_005168, partial [Prymnesium sp.]
MFALISALAAAAAAFGNLDVSWMPDGKPGSTAKAPTVKTGKTLKNWKPTPELRRNNLEALSEEELRKILSWMDGSCEQCTSRAHWTSKIRHAVLDLQKMKLKSELKRRGIT